MPMSYTFSGFVQFSKGELAQMTSEKGQMGIANTAPELPTD